MRQPRVLDVTNRNAGAEFETKERTVTECQFERMAIRILLILDRLHRSAAASVNTVSRFGRAIACLVEVNVVWMLDLLRRQQWQTMRNLTGSDQEALPLTVWNVYSFELP